MEKLKLVFSGLVNMVPKVAGFIGMPLSLIGDLKTKLLNTLVNAVIGYIIQKASKIYGEEELRSMELLLLKVLDIVRDTLQRNLSSEKMGSTTKNPYLVDLADKLRQAWQVQSLLELDARGGTRYTEILLNHFNVVSPDFRLQRPEYLGGGEIRVESHVVPQTSSTTGSYYRGDLSSFSTASTVGKNIGFTKSFVEHGYVIGLACPRGDVTYQQGLHRMWFRSTRYDFFWPKLQEIGEQAVYNKEIYVANDGANDSVWGYIGRYDEYRFKPSEVHGQLRSYASSTFDIYHLADKYTSRPALNSTWMPQATPITRNMALTTYPQFTMDIYYKYLHARPMMTHAVPSTLGRF